MSEKFYIFWTFQTKRPQKERRKSCNPNVQSVKSDIFETFKITPTSITKDIFNSNLINILRLINEIKNGQNVLTNRDMLGSPVLNCPSTRCLKTNI